MSQEAQTSETAQAPPDQAPKTPLLPHALQKRPSILRSCIFWAVAVLLLAVGTLVWLGGSLTTRDLLPATGSAADRWWTAVLLVSTGTAAAGFLSVVALVRWTLPRNLGRRSSDSKQLIFPTDLLLLEVSLVIVAGLLVLVGTFASPDAWQSANRAYYADLVAGGRELLSPLTDAWRDANRSPIIAGERPPAVEHRLPPVAEQLARQKERLERWCVAADELVGMAEKMRRPMLREIDGFLATPPADAPLATNQPSFARPDESIFQIVQAATPQPAAPTDWFEADTRSARKGNPVYLWFAPRSQITTDIPAALKELSKSREDLLIRASRLRARELVHLADTLEIGANYADPDKLLFLEAVHALELLAAQKDKVEQLIAQNGSSFADFKTNQLNEWKKDNLRGTQSRWIGGLNAFTNVAGVTVVRPRNNVYVTINKLLTIGRDHCQAALKPGSDAIAGAVSKSNRDQLSYALTLVPSLIVGFVPPLGDKMDKAAFKKTVGIDHYLLRDWSETVNASVALSTTPARTEAEILTAYDKMFEAIAGIDSNLRPKWADGLKELHRQVGAWNEAREQLRGFVVLLEDYEARQPSDTFDPFYGTTLTQCIARLRDDIDGLPNPFDAARLGTDSANVRANLVELAKQKAWLKLHMKPDHPFLKFPAQWPPDLAHVVLLEARIQDVWENDVIHRKSDEEVLFPDGVEKLANELALKAREQMVTLLGQLADEFAAQWYAAVTDASLDQARQMERDGVSQIKTDDKKTVKSESFWGHGVATAGLPYWLKEYWARKENNAQYDIIVAQTKPPPNSKLIAFRGVTIASPNAAAAMREVLDHHRMWWDKGGYIDKLVKAFEDENFTERDDMCKICGAYWTLVGAGSGAGWPNPFEEIRSRGDQLLKGEGTTKLTQKANDSTKPPTILDDEIARRRTDPITVYEKLVAYYGAEAETKIQYRDPNLRNFINSYLEEKRRKASSGGVRNTGGMDE